jgi:pyruvate kinase
MLYYFGLKLAISKMTKKTKIVATIGPASWDDKVLKQMIDNGMNGARINASFADAAEIERVGKKIRKLSSDVALILDTKGNKIRLSAFQKNIKVKTGSLFSIFANKTKKGVHLVSETDLNLEKQIQPDTIILVDDGTIKLKVDELKGNELVCKVLQGGELRSGKSVNIPGVHINFPEIAKKDYDDILTAKKFGYDYISASFVRNESDLKAVKKLVKDSHIKVIAKIEDMEGVNNFDSILELADGIMIARGDLGVEIPAEQVPSLQKKFIEKCNELGKPVIVATQMLQSMTENISATRAEVNDVANAIYDGADAVMLSAETSVGKFPVEAVSTMNKIALEVEQDVNTMDRIESPLAKPTTNAIAKAVFDACNSLPVDKVIVATATGTTAKTIARFRPKQPIFAFTNGERAKRQLAISRGIVSDIIRISSSTRDTGVQALVKNAKVRGFVSDSDLVVVVAGANIMQQGETNLLEINRVEHIIG